MNHSHQKSRFESYSESQPQFASHVPVIAHSGTWLQLLAMDESFLRGPTNSLSFGNPGGAQANRPDGMCFDANGNLLAETSPPCPPAVPTYTYDAENRLVNYMGGSAAYTYDGNGLRVKKVSGGTTTVYIFSGGKDIAEYDNGVAPASPSREYIYSGAQLLATITGSGATATTTYHHADHLSVRVSTDGTTGSPTLGQKIGEQGHFPFGEPWFTSNTTTKFFFTTYERDSESGLDYARARFYSGVRALIEEPLTNRSRHASGRRPTSDIQFCSSLDVG